MLFFVGLVVVVGVCVACDVAGVSVETAGGVPVDELVDVANEYVSTVFTGSFDLVVHHCIPTATTMMILIVASHGNLFCDFCSVVSII
jgi:hypothetical protein